MDIQEGMGSTGIRMEKMVHHRREAEVLTLVDSILSQPLAMDGVFPRQR